MLIEPALQKITASINAVLTKDPDFLSALAVLQNICLAINIQGLGLIIYVHINSDSFNLTRAKPEQAPQVTIEGAPLALFMLLFSTDALQAAQSSGIKIQGDLHIARQLSETVQKLDIDWEGILAEYVGDIAAYQIGSGVQQVKAWRSRVHESWLAALSEYLQEESRSLPTRVEVEQYLDEVDGVRDSVARLEVRLTQLK